MKGYGGYISTFLPYVQPASGARGVPRDHHPLGSLNPFVGYEGLSRLEAGISLGDGSAIREHIAYPEQVHGARVHPCVRSDAGSIRLQADGLVGADPSLILAAYAADCIPLLLYDPKTGADGALHAGQKGLLTGIVAAGIGTLTEQYGSSHVDVLVGIGPCIRPCCYQVREDLVCSLAMALTLHSDLLFQHLLFFSGGSARKRGFHH